MFEVFSSSLQPVLLLAAASALRLATVASLHWVKSQVWVTVTSPGTVTFATAIPLTTSSWPVVLSTVNRMFSILMVPPVKLFAASTVSVNTSPASISFPLSENCASFVDDVFLNTSTFFWADATSVSDSPSLTLMSA